MILTILDVGLRRCQKNHRRPLRFDEPNQFVSIAQIKLTKAGFDATRGSDWIQTARLEARIQISADHAGRADD